MGGDDARRSEPRAEHVDGKYQHYQQQQRRAAERAGAPAVQSRTCCSLNTASPVNFRHSSFLYHTHRIILSFPFLFARGIFFITKKICIYHTDLFQKTQGHSLYCGHIRFVQRRSESMRSKRRKNVSVLVIFFESRF